MSASNNRKNDKTLKQLPRSQKAYACPDHPDAILIDKEHEGDLVCSQCGIVVGDHMPSFDIEDRQFSEDEEADRSRIGQIWNNYHHIDYNMSTAYSYSKPEDELDKYGRQRDYKRLIEMTEKSRELKSCYEEVDSVALVLRLPQKVIDEVNNILKGITDKNLDTDPDPMVTIGAAIYIACREMRALRTLKEIAQSCSVDKPTIVQCSKSILTCLNRTLAAVRVEDYLPRYCALLQVEPRVQRLASCFLKKVQESDIAPGRAPPTIASACIYMACRAHYLKTTLKDVSDVTGISETTLSHLYEKLRIHAASLYPTDFHVPRPFSQFLSN